ncbi:MAG: glycine/betaine ABC transporter substrate-binding protein [Candidatus Caldatribacterium sp.]|nr:glycine/betaine ABC transporter substrate-binding protein [Candidatus Caldatribacterium sp.]
MFLGFLGIVLVGSVVFGQGWCIRSEATAEEASGVVVMSNKPFTESYILAEIIVQLLEHHTDLRVERRIIEGGTTSILHPALVNGEIDLYPEYTGTAWQEVLRKENIIRDPLELYEAVKKEYRERFGLVWLPLFGFNNTFTLAVRRESAEKDNLTTFSDLARVSEKYVFGAEPDFFERKDGYENLVATYGFRFRGVKQMAIALKYPAILSREVDVINAFSTDGLLRKFDLVILQDDKNFFPSYFCAPVVRGEIVERYPEVAEVLGRLAGRITDEEMTEMNYLVDEERRDPKDVARDFLEREGLI